MNFKRKHGKDITHDAVAKFGAKDGRETFICFSKEMAIVQMMFHK